MSKIGKINISIPEKVKVAVVGNILNIEGPLGKKTLNIDFLVEKHEVFKEKSFGEKSYRLVKVLF